MVKSPQCFCGSRLGAMNNSFLLVFRSFTAEAVTHQWHLIWGRLVLVLFPLPLLGEPARIQPMFPGCLLSSFTQLWSPGFNLVTRHVPFQTFCFYCAGRHFVGQLIPQLLDTPQAVATFFWQLYGVGVVCILNIFFRFGHRWRHSGAVILCWSDRSSFLNNPQFVLYIPCLLT